ncbi:MULTISPECIES: HrpB1 family type III secretion system apparatus protein [unclassified Caballeronia]|uniref:HrpB1 family type III secretion system apparatus protein n=1 Tax=unclassified Caballeronia TaxID=2646786 RepID=UPI002027CCE8|nr:MULTISPECIES: HrpB1 family type III secretion system apparatus protein [unclassified Caballeronia]
MDDASDSPVTTADFYSKILADLNEGRVDEAARSLLQMKESAPQSREFAILKVLCLIKVNRAADALHFLNELGSDIFLDLRALCLYALKDRLWIGLATELQHSDDPKVRRAMRVLLDRAQER